MHEPDHSIDVSEQAGVRYLHFGSEWIQGAMRIARPWALELAYTREMMAGLLLHPDAGWPRRVLLVGLGAASLSKFIYRHLPDSRQTVVEINPAVVAVARHCFKLPQEDDRLELVVADGFDYLAESTDHFDWILIDGFDPDARAGRLDTAAFYAATHRRLAGGGLLTCNLLGRNRGFERSVERIAAAFDGRTVVFPSCDSGNAIAFAATGDRLVCNLDGLRERARTVKKTTGLDLLPTISRLQLSQAFPNNCLTL